MIINGAQITCGNSPAKAAYLLVAGGRAPDSTWLRSAAHGCKVVCADKGVFYCQKAGVRPYHLVGDGDSAGESWQWAKENGVSIDEHPSDKDQTDLQLALDYILKNDDTADIIITGAWGGRFDHSYNNVCSALAAAGKTTGQVILSDEKETMVILPGPDDLTVQFASSPETISILPLSDSIRASIEGAKWEIKDKTVEKTYIYTISNKLQQGKDSLKIALHEGQAGVYFLMKN